MNKTFVAEVPYFATRLEAESAEIALKLLKDEAGKVIDKYGILEDITGRKVPTPEEALKAKSNTLLDKQTNMVHMCLSLSLAGGYRPYTLGNTQSLFQNKYLSDLSGKTCDGKDDDYQDMPSWTLSVVSKETNITRRTAPTSTTPVETKTA